MMIDVKKQALDYGIIACSFHEASHTVCAIHNCIKISSVHTSSETVNEGTTDYYTLDVSVFEDNDLLTILLMQELQVLYGGLVGEKIYYREICGSEKFPMHLRIGSSSDISAASNLIVNHDLAKPGKHRMLLKKKIQSDVAAILNEHWSAVKIVAHALYKKKRLSFEELQHLLTRKTDNKDFWKDRFKKIRLLYNETSNLDETSIRDIILEDSVFTL